MRLQIFFTPTDLSVVDAQAQDIYIVIDLIRATTTLTVMCEQGAQRIFIADTLEQARAAAQQRPGSLLCGERNVLPLPGFDYGNSPAQFAQTDLRGRELILTTTNGTRAFFACPPESTRVAGCFYNAQKVTAYALKQARLHGSNIALICAGEARYFALDDATCAGYLAQQLLQQQPVLETHESVHAALALYQEYAPPRLLDYCDSARKVAQAGLQADLDLCIRLNGSSSIAEVIGRDATSGLLVLEQRGA